MKRLLVAGLVCLAATSAVGQSSDSSIAALYVEAAIEASVRGDYAAARELVSTGIEFGSGLSDVYHVDSFLLAVSGDRAAALEQAETARELASWDLVSPTAGAGLHLLLLVQMLRADEAAQLALGAPSLPADESGELRALYWAQLTALRAAGLWSEYESLLLRALDRFPDSPRFLWLTIQDDRLAGVETRRRLERLLGEESVDGLWLERPFWIPTLEDAVHEFALRSEFRGDREWAAETLRERAWEDQRLALLIADTDSGAAVRLVEQSDESLNIDLAQALLATLPAESRARLERFLSEFTGTAFRDVNGDSYPDEYLEAELGRVREFSRDRNQDGDPELLVQIAEGSPVLAELAINGQLHRARYGQYPFLQAVDVEVEGGLERFEVRPRTLRLELVAFDGGEPFAVGSGTRLVENPRILATGELVRGAVQSSIVSGSGVEIERRYHEAGEIVRIMRDEDEDGVWDRLMTTTGGRPDTGIRDTDADGYFEIAEGYRNGRLVALAIDSDRDGIPEYFEQRSGLPEREWDLNGDGSIDVREFDWWTDRVIREFPGQ